MMKLSVVIPVYNGASFVKHLYDSLKSQNTGLFARGEIELLFVNDGSKDDSSSVLQSMAANDPAVKVIQKENGGIASARDKGLSLCKGDYITFCDQDDEVVAGYEPYMRKMEEGGQTSLYPILSHRYSPISPKAFSLEMTSWREKVKNYC